MGDMQQLRLHWRIQECRFPSCETGHEWANHAVRGEDLDCNPLATRVTTMCLIAWNWQPDAEQPLLLIANRDEFYARPTLPLHRWADAPISAGKDLQAGGTWLGLAPDGRMAALTNVRDPRKQRADAPSRGALVSHFLSGKSDAHHYLQSIVESAPQFNPFNLLVYDGQTLLGFESQGARIVSMQPGIAAVSNAGFDTPWPKLVALKSGLQDWLAQQSATQGSSREALFELLAHDQPVPDAQLPDTGIPIERERALSSAFIRGSDYGTRASSLVMLRRNSARFMERSFDAKGFTGEVQLEIY